MITAKKIGIIQQEMEDWLGPNGEYRKAIYNCIQVIYFDSENPIYDTSKKLTPNWSTVIPIREGSAIQNIDDVDAEIQRMIVVFEEQKATPPPPHPLLSEEARQQYITTTLSELPKTDQQVLSNQKAELEKLLD